MPVLPGIKRLPQKQAGTQWKSSPPIGQKTRWDHGLGFDIPALEETGWPFNCNSIQHQPLRKPYQPPPAGWLNQTEPVLPPCKLHDLGRLVTSILLILICKYDPTLKDNLECKHESIAAPYVASGESASCQHKHIHLQINRFIRGWYRRVRVHTSTEIWSGPSCGTGSGWLFQRFTLITLRNVADRETQDTFIKF